MPCSDDQSRGNAGSNRLEVAQLRAELDARTAMLCAVMTICEAEEQRMDDSVFGHLPPDALVWWHEHKKWDQRRKAVEGK